MQAWREKSKEYLGNHSATEEDVCNKQNNVIDTPATLPDEENYNKFKEELKKGGLTDAMGCGEQRKLSTGPADPLGSLEIRYCPKDFQFCCDEGDIGTSDNSSNHMLWAVRNKSWGICFKNEEDVRCKTYAQGNHSHNFRWHYRNLNNGACNLRQHKFRQRQMWWKLYQAYGAFREYFACMGEYRAEGFRPDDEVRTDAIAPIVVVDDELAIPPVIPGTTA